MDFLPHARSLSQRQRSLTTCNVSIITAVFRLCCCSFARLLRGGSQAYPSPPSSSPSQSQACASPPPCKTSGLSNLCDACACSHIVRHGTSIHHRRRRPFRRHRTDTKWHEQLLRRPLELLRSHPAVAAGLQEHSREQRLAANWSCGRGRTADSHDDSDCHTLDYLPGACPNTYSRHGDHCAAFIFALPASCWRWATCSMSGVSDY